MVAASLDHPPTYTPRGAARELLVCKDDEVLIEGPAGTGKTRAVWVKGDILCREVPGIRGLALRKTRSSMSETVMPIYEKYVNPAIARGLKRSHRQSYDYDNGSVIVLGGLDNDNADRVMSAEYDFILEFEATELTEDDHEKVGTRLRSPVWRHKQQIAECNPGAPTHWLNQRAKAGKMRRLVSRHEDNPACTDEYIRTRLDTLTGVRYLRLRKGIWAAAEGVVYDGWDAAVHLIDPFDIPRDWRRFRSIDFGFTNPFVCQWWAMDPDGRLYLYREIYKTQRLVRDHAERIKELSAGESIEATVRDHDAENAATLASSGIDSVPAKKDVCPGLEAVAARLRPAGDGRPRLFVFRTALTERDETLAERKAPLCTADEFDSYLWKKARDGAAIKEEPEKVHDHGMDAMRYLVMHLDGGWCYGFDVAARGSPVPAVLEPQESSDAYADLVAERNRRWDTGR